MTGIPQVPVTVLDETPSRSGGMLPPLREGAFSISSVDGAFIGHDKTPGG